MKMPNLARLCGAALLPLMLASCTAIPTAPRPKLVVFSS